MRGGGQRNLPDASSVASLRWVKNPNDAMSSEHVRARQMGRSLRAGARLSAGVKMDERAAIDILVSQLDEIESPVGVPMSGDPASNESVFDGLRDLVRTSYLSMLTIPLPQPPSESPPRPLPPRAHQLQRDLAQTELQRAESELARLNDIEQTAPSSPAAQTQRVRQRTSAEGRVRAYTELLVVMDTAEEVESQIIAARATGGIPPT